MSTPVTDQILVCSSCSAKKFFGDAFRYECVHCKTNFCRRCAGFMDSSNAEAARLQKDYVCNTCNPPLTANTVMAPSSLPHAPSADLTSLTAPALSAAPSPPSSSNIPTAPSSPTDPTLSTILSAINSLEIRPSAQNTTTHNDLQQLRQSINTRLDALEASCSTNAASV
eukprot:GHVN01064886.1.p1 GENE.GHVN01064886.1~~GHVN01064886.1.p1  ORF type:complete len:192 (-),score=16.47 GHVN01064886.1:17-523(-)